MKHLVLALALLAGLVPALYVALQLVRLIP